MIKAAILAVGDELTCGYRLDTNSQAVSRSLSIVPLKVVLHTSVGDEMSIIHRGLDMSLELADVVIVTGGLGPTEDDLTRQAIASYFGLELVEDSAALARLKQRFARYRRTMPASNVIQAHVPAGSVVIPNDRGTASGFYLQTQGKHLFTTPGIPREMTGMMETFILPRLRDLVGSEAHVRRAALKVYGIPESAINERIRPMMVRGRNPLLGLLPHRGTITVEVAATGATPEEADALLAEDLTVLRAELGKHILSEDERELPQVVADLLLEKGLTLALAEVGTAGLLAARLTEPEDAFRWLTSASIHSSVSEAVDQIGAEAASEMPEVTLASTIRRVSGSDIGLAVGGISIHDKSDAARAHGTVSVGIDVGGSTVHREIAFPGNRLRVREWMADSALSLLRNSLLSLA